MYSSTLFDYHLKLHYSQTPHPRTHTPPEFDYHLKLHYSQTVVRI